MPKPSATAKRRLRRPGRPAAIHEADQRERLLEAALACFTTASMAATSMTSVARQAGVTPALVNYYFGDKQSLIAAVIAERILPAVAQLQAELQSAGSEPASMLSGFVHGLHAVVERHPWLPILWVREILTEGGALRGMMVSQVAPGMTHLLADRLALAQRAGKINAALDPRLMVVSLIGLTMFPLAAESLWRQLFKADDIDHAALRRHTLALIAHGLETGHED